MAKQKVDNISYFDLKKINGKGMGLIANADIKCGTVIICEKPVIYIPRKLNNKSEMELRMHIINQLKGLQPKIQFKILSLHDSFKNNNNNNQSIPQLLINVWRTNSHKINNENSTISNGLFLNSSRINHSCQPNCQGIYLHKIGQRIVFAVQDIRKGTELTCNYIDNNEFMCFMDRQKYLEKHYMFKCKCMECMKCIKNKKYLIQKDNVIKEINKLNNSVNICTKAMKFNDAIKHLNKIEMNIMKHFDSFPTKLSVIYFKKAQIYYYLQKFNDSIKYTKMCIDIEYKFYGKNNDWTLMSKFIQSFPPKFQDHFKTYTNIL